MGIFSGAGLGRDDIDDLELSCDAEGNIINTKDTRNGTDTDFGATYDTLGRLRTVSYNNGLFQATYTYDANCRLTGVSDNLSGARMGFAYDIDGSLTKTTRTNGVATTYEWSDGGRLVGIAQGSLAEMGFTLDETGNVTKAEIESPLDPTDFLTEEKTALDYDDTSQIETSGYAYDARGRLVKAPHAAYRWDAAGRLVRNSDAAYAYKGNDDLLSRTDEVGTPRFSLEFQWLLRAKKGMNYKGPQDDTFEDGPIPGTGKGLYHTRIWLRAVQPRHHAV